jgi:hypothetical protein
MKCTLDGTRIRDIPSFIAELNRVIADATGERANFGWDLHSLQDSLHGGYGGSPPFDIVVEDAEDMLSAMDHAGLARYCDEILRVIDAGGRGLEDELSRSWYEAERAKAMDGQGRNLLDRLFETIKHSPAELTLLSHSGDVLASSKDPPREAWEPDEPIKIPGAS